MTNDTPATAELRKRFEVIVSQPPYERSTKRFGPNAGFPGQYIAYELQFAWDVLKELAKCESVSVPDYKEWHPCLDDNCPYCKP
jgi:hypothetical protein